jgi:hypothetical protein
MERCVWGALLVDLWVLLFLSAYCLVVSRFFCVCLCCVCVCVNDVFCVVLMNVVAVVVAAVLFVFWLFFFLLLLLLFLLLFAAATIVVVLFSRRLFCSSQGGSVLCASGPGLSRPSGAHVEPRLMVMSVPCSTTINMKRHLSSAGAQFLAPK